MSFRPFVAILFASVALSGCCSIGPGCNAPISGVATAWDGLGTDPSGKDDEIEPRRKSARHHEISVGPVRSAAKPPDADAQPEDRWARQTAEDQAADAKLSKQLRICTNC